MGNNALFYRNLWQAGFASRRYFFGGFGNPPFFVIPTERSGGGISISGLISIKVAKESKSVEDWQLDSLFLAGLFLQMERWLANAQHDVNFWKWICPLLSGYSSSWRGSSQRNDVVNKTMEDCSIVFSSMFRQSAASEESLHFYKDSSAGRNRLWRCWGLKIGFFTIGWFFQLMERWFAGTHHDVIILISHPEERSDEWIWSKLCQ